MSKRRRDLFKDKEHLLRMAGIFAGGIVLFLVMHMLLVPKTFGLYGHYRAAAMSDVAAKPLSYAGRAACAECHANVVELQKAGKHATLGCEACHGPQLRHAGQPMDVKPVKLDTKKLCPTCHTANPARPKWFKQVKVQEHSSGEACDTCHQPHSPQMGDGK
jgi:hypothetical protein